MALASSFRLPAVMREGAVGLGHPVRLFALLHGVAAVVGGVQEFAGEALDHGALVAGAGRRDEPPDRQGLTPLDANLDGYLVGGAADAPRPDLDLRHHVLQRL